MPKGADDLLRSLSKRIEKLEKENKKIKEILSSAKPLKCIYKAGSPLGWNRHYHTEEEFLQRHIDNWNFEPDVEDDDIGYLLKIDPKSLIKK